MTENTIDKFKEDREKFNDIMKKHAGLPMKRFHALDSQVYEDGALPKKTKELIGLVASMVQRCDDCITYHLIQCRECGITDGELTEALSIALIVGGSVTIPHQRKAFRIWEELKGNG